MFFLHPARALGLAVIVFACFFGAARVAHAAVFVVNSTEDNADGTCVDPYVDAASDCTWREAITAANNAVGPDTIVFAIDSSFPDDGDGQWTITLTSSTATLSGPTTVTAASAWDTDDFRPGIKISREDGAGTLVSFVGLATGSRVQGIEFSGGDTSVAVGASNVMIGTDCDGTLDMHERNVMYGTTTQGIVVANASGAKIRGNYIGVLSDGVTGSSFGTYGIRITGANGDNNLVGYQEGTNDACPGALQRNVIGGGEDGLDAGISIGSVAATNVNGDAAVAPNGNIVAGNYIGIGADGLSPVAGVAGSGVIVTNAATGNFIGTDGDGTDDARERNVIGGWDRTGVIVLGTGSNRIAGNLIGFGANGIAKRPNEARGILLDGGQNIVGWCDPSVDAVLCGDSGTDSDQANVIGNNGEGIRLGANCDGCSVFGNMVGTGALGATDFGNDLFGIFIARGSLGSHIGGSFVEQRNTISYNRDGVRVDGFYSEDPFIPGPTEGYTIQNNLISLNDFVGVHLLGSEQDGTSGPSDGTVSDNDITLNGREGVRIEGASPTISGNAITGNATIGIYVLSTYRRDEPETTGLLYNNPYDRLSPGNAANDTVSQPLITGNSITDNETGGILILDADADNVATLADDNVFDQIGTYNVRRDWYASLELLDENGDTLTEDDFSVVLSPANNAECTASCVSTTFSSDGAGGGIWGPDGVDYTDPTTWFVVTEFLVDDLGVRTDFNPYRVQITGRRQGAGGAAYRVTFDGDQSNDTDTGRLPSAIHTGNVDRYQINEFLTQPNKAPPTATSVLPPTPLEPVALSTDTIRWFFRDNAVFETGFRILVIDEAGERTVVDSGANVVRDLSYLDETGLEPGTEYCHRFAVTVRGTTPSGSVELPCARTLPAGSSSVSPESIAAPPDVIISQAAFLVSDPAAASATPVAAGAGVFGASMVVGHLHARRRRMRGHMGRTGHIYGLASIVGLAGCSLAILFLSCPGVCLGLPTTAAFAASSANLVPVTARMELVEGDRVRLSFEVSNIGGSTAENLQFSDEFPAGLEPDPESVERALATLGGGNVARSLGDLLAGTSVIVKFDVLVTRSEEGTLQNTAAVSGDNVPASSSNVIDFSVIPPPPQVEGGVRPFLLYRAEDDNDGTLYMIDADLTRRPFPNDDIFYTWFRSKTFVRTIPNEQLAQIPLGDPMLPRAGSLLVRSSVGGDLYAVEPGQTLRRLSNDARAEELYGEDWEKFVLNADDVLLRRFVLGKTLEDGEIPDGHLLTDGTTVCYILNNRCREVSENGMSANRFFSRFVHKTHTSRLDSFRRGAPITNLDPALLSDRAE